MRFYGSKHEQGLSHQAGGPSVRDRRRYGQSVSAAGGAIAGSSEPGRGAIECALNEDL